MPAICASYNTFLEIATPKYFYLRRKIMAFSIISHSRLNQNNECAHNHCLGLVAFKMSLLSGAQFIIEIISSFSLRIVPYIDVAMHNISDQVPLSRFLKFHCDPHCRSTFTCILYVSLMSRIY